MKIGVVSDLHTEYWRDREFAVIGDLVKKRIGSADHILLAGDIGSGPGAIEAAARLFPDKMVCMVAGNHEFYGSGHDHTISVIEEAAQNYPNITFLNRSTYIADGLRVIGCTLWTDFNLFGTQPLSMGQVALRNYEKNGSLTTPYPDFCHIYDGDDFVMPDRILEWHMRDREWLLDEIQKPFDGKTVVMTHHAPVEFSLHSRFARDSLSPCFASRLDYPLMNSKLDMVVWGHTHNSVNVVHGDTRFVSNQVGYFKEDGSIETGDFGTLVVL